VHGANTKLNRLLLRESVSLLRSTQRGEAELDVDQVLDQLAVGLLWPALSQPREQLAVDLDGGCRRLSHKPILRRIDDLKVIESTSRYGVTAGSRRLTHRP